ncbi:hypothetical protein D3C84_805640 [compost metagenome]
MDERHDRMTVTVEDDVAEREEQPGQADEQKKIERQEVVYKRLLCPRLHIADSAVECHGDAADDHEGCNVKRVIEQKSEHAVRLNPHHVDAEPDDRVHAVVLHREVHPAEHKRERDERGQHAAPAEQHMLRPAVPAAVPDEAVRHQMLCRRLGRASPEDQLDAFDQNNACRRALRPCDEPIEETADEDDSTDHIAVKCKIDMGEPS